MDVLKILGIFLFLFVVFPAVFLVVGLLFVLSFYPLRSVLLRCVIFLFVPFSLFVSPVSPMLSLLTVRVLQKGTSGRCMQGRGLGAVIKDRVTDCIISEKECLSYRYHYRWIQVSGYF